MNIFDQLLADNQIPKFVRVRHEMDRGHIDDIEGAVAQAMQREGTLDRIKPGDSVCITAGSRDVANIARVIRAICDQVKSVGAHPFIIPAMGSHAGAKAEGQRGIIEGYGVTEEAMGAPIRATMDTEVIAHAKSGLEIHLDKYANAADFLIPGRAASRPTRTFAARSRAASARCSSSAWASSTARISATSSASRAWLPMSRNSRAPSSRRSRTCLPSASSRTPIIRPAASRPSRPAHPRGGAAPAGLCQEPHGEDPVRSGRYPVRRRDGQGHQRRWHGSERHGPFSGPRHQPSVLPAHRRV